MFETRSEWWNHELQFHRKQWHCNETGHSIFHTEDEFKNHLRKEHLTWFTEPQLPSLVKMYERPIQAASIRCPLCTDDYEIVGDIFSNETYIRRDPKFLPNGIFKRHLGRHLERLALFAISSTEHPNDNEEEAVPSDYVASGGSRLSLEDTDSSSLNKDVSSGRAGKYASRASHFYL
jgi:hypothetical protein